MISKKYLVPFGVIFVTILAVWLINSNPPKSGRKTPLKAPQISVEIEALTPIDYRVLVESYGIVSPRTESILVSQVSGQIHYVSPQFRDGGFFEEGDVLVKLDDRDYQAEVKIAESTLISARQTLLEEQALAQQAIVDWQRLGNGAKANALVLREPQLAAAKASVLSAEAQLEQANLALQRSAIVAPYAGRILTTYADLGQVVSANGQLADIYAVDFLEVRLPINNGDLPYVELPEEYRDRPLSLPETDVTLFSDLGVKQQWHGKVVRTESAINSDAQQLFVVAQIDDPYASNKETGISIKIGQYVSARLSGKVIKDALVIPNSAIYQGSYVYIEQDGILLRKDIDIAWQNGAEALINAGLNPGEHLVLTPLGQVNSGTPVSVQEQMPARPENDKRSNSKSSQVAKAGAKQ